MKGGVTKPNVCMHLFNLIERTRKMSIGTTNKILSEVHLNEPYNKLPPWSACTQ